MIRFLSLLLFVFSTVCALKVMTYNQWNSGDNIEKGHEKAARHIYFINPDIATLQESGNEQKYEDLLEYLNKFEIEDNTGEKWSGVVPCNGGIGVITRHKILSSDVQISSGVNVQVQLKGSGQVISVWSMHLAWQEYGPYVALEKDKTMDEILKGETNHRVPNIVELLKHPSFVEQIHNSDAVPVIVAGDFNVPSHLDWIEETKKIHNGWIVEWPVTKLLTEAAGMTDSFREINPDPNAVPGFTWTVYKEGDGKEREKDRIDFIFYRGSLSVKASYTYSGKSKIVNDDWRNNDWQSDHWAVVTEFENNKMKSQSSFDINPKFLNGHGDTLKVNCANKILPLHSIL